MKAVCSRCHQQPVAHPWQGPLCEGCQDVLGGMTRAQVEAEYDALRRVSDGLGDRGES